MLQAAASGQGWALCSQGRSFNNTVQLESTCCSGRSGFSAARANLHPFICLGHGRQLLGVGIAVRWAAYWAPAGLCFLHLLMPPGPLKQPSKIQDPCPASLRVSSLCSVRPEALAWPQELCAAAFLPPCLTERRFNLPALPARGHGVSLPLCTIHQYPPLQCRAVVATLSYQSGIELCSPGPARLLHHSPWPRGRPGSKPSLSICRHRPASPDGLRVRDWGSRGLDGSIPISREARTLIWSPSY